MYQTASTVTLNLTTGAITQSDPVSARASLSITLTGTGSLVNSNIKAALYRLNRVGIDGTLVATCDTFTGPANAFVGAMSLNTAEVVAAFTDLVSLREYETCEFTLLVYDASQAVYLYVGKLDVAYEYPLAAGTPPSVSPITSSTTTWGNYKLIAGVIHIQSATDGKWYPLTLAGQDSTVHEVLGETGVP
jgi:hypothetical protein